MTLVAPLIYPTLGGTASPLGVQFGQRWTLQGPDGTTAVFNDPTSPNYVGAITDVSGFDSPEVRENAGNLVQLDGGVHGDFFYGRRPITMSGTIYNVADVADRNVKLELLKRSTDAMRPQSWQTGPAGQGNARLSWTSAGGSPVYLDLRRQQPLRVSGGWNKDFQLSMVAADPRIYSTTLRTATAGPSSTAATCANYGNTMTYPVYTITSPVYLPQITNTSTGSEIRVNIDLITAGHTLVIDSFKRTAIYDGATNVYGAIDFLATNWDGLPGASVSLVAFSATASGAGAGLTITWRDAYL